MNQNQQKSRNVAIYYLLTACLLWIVFYIPFIRFQILHIDEAVYLIIAKKILKGAVPYLDVWDHKPPMVFWLYAFILKIFGTGNFIPINIVTLLFNLVSTILIFKITKLLTNRTIAGITALIYPILSNVLLFRDAINPNTEIYMTPFFLYAVYLSLRIFLSGEKKNFLLAGLAVGMASAFKQPSGIVLIALSIGIILFNLKDKKWKYILYAVISLWLGCFIVWFFIGLYFLWKGALWEFWFQAFEFNFLYGATMSQLFIWMGVLHNYLFSLKLCPLFFIPFFGAVIFSLVYLFLPRQDFRKKCILIFLLIWHACDVVAISKGGRMYHHYLVQWMPSLMILTFVSITYAFEMFLKNRKTIATVIGLIYCVLFIIKMFVPVEQNNPDNRTINEYRTPVQAFMHARKCAKVIGPWIYKFPYYRKPRTVWDQMNMVKMVQSYVKPGDPVFVWGFAPEIYLLFNRPPASRFVYTLFVTGNFSAMANLYDPADSSLRKYKDRIEKLLIDDLQASRPKFIVAVDKEPNKYTKFFFDYLSENYKRIDADMPLDMYIRKDNGPAINNRIK